VAFKDGSTGEVYPRSARIGTAARPWKNTKPPALHRGLRSMLRDLQAPADFLSLDPAPVESDRQVQGCATEGAV
jgi:hypothetical protein